MLHENLCMEHRNFPTKTQPVHSARRTQCIHHSVLQVSAYKQQIRQEGERTHTHTKQTWCGFTEVRTRPYKFYWQLPLLKEWLYKYTHTHTHTRDSWNKTLPNWAQNFTLNDHWPNRYLLHLLINCIFPTKLLPIVSVVMSDLLKVTLASKYCRNQVLWKLYVIISEFLQA